MKKYLAVLFALTLLSSPAFAEKEGTASDPVQIGTFSAWKAYYFEDDAGKVCFMSAVPSKQEGKFKGRDPVLFFITHWAGTKTKNVVSISAGYTYKDKSTATVTIDKRDFKLATVEAAAWARNHATDDEIVGALRKASRMTVKGQSKRGTDITDTYDLKGSASAYDAITKTCGL